MKREATTAMCVSAARVLSRIRTRSGVLFDASGTTWSYADGVTYVSINFDHVAWLSDEMLASYKGVLQWYAENAAPSSLVNLNDRMVHLGRTLVSQGMVRIEQLTTLDLLNYKAALSEEKAFYLGSLARLLKKCDGLGLAGVSKEACALLDDLRLKGNRKGEAVLTLDPVIGPYTVLEQEAIQSALHDAFVDGSIDRSMYLLAWLFIALGARPIQYAALKVCDLTATKSAEGDVSYMLSVPRAKQRDADCRSEFKNRPLIAQLGHKLLQYAESVKQSYQDLLDDTSQAPLFPRSSPGEASPGYEFHRTSKGIGAALQAALRKLDVYSERTGRPLNVAPVRFRRTFATNAAQEGHGELVIAELLDHNDTQNVGVYVAAVPEITTRIDRAVAMKMAPLAQAFKGLLIKGESRATRGNDPASRIIDLRVDRSAKPMGSCGQHSFCGFAAPIACYTCRAFEAWLDGPHEAVLEHLLAERERLLATTDERMAAVNDRTILAVAQVVQLCSDSRELPGKLVGDIANADRRAADRGANG